MRNVKRFKCCCVQKLKSTQQASAARDVLPDLRHWLSLLITLCQKHGSRVDDVTRQSWWFALLDVASEIDASLKTGEEEKSNT